MTDQIKITDARMQLADIVNRVVYGRDRILLMRHGRAAAAIVTVEDFELLESLRHVDLTSTGGQGGAGLSGDPGPGEPGGAEPGRIAAEYRPVQPKGRPGFRA